MKTAIKIFILVCLFLSSLYAIDGKMLEAIYLILIAMYNKPNNGNTTINYKQ